VQISTNAIWSSQRLGVTGWVRNRRDGTVEAVVDGAPEAIEAILALGAPRRARILPRAVARGAGYLRAIA